MTSIIHKTWVIYTLSDPRTPNDVRYVGVTHRQPKARLQRHISNAKKLAVYHSSKWIRSLLQDGLEPEMVIIHVGTGDTWESIETFWIQWHRERGFRLTNQANGGRGPVGCKRTPETRARLAAANLGKKLSLETRAKKSAGNRGKVINQEVRAKIGDANRGKKRTEKTRAAMRAVRATPEWRSRVSESNKETWQRKHAGLRKKSERQQDTETSKVSAETKAKMSASRMGKTQSAETKAKKQASMKRVWAERKAIGWVGWYE